MVGLTQVFGQFFTVAIKELPDEKFFAKQSAKAMMASPANQSTK